MAIKDFQTRKHAEEFLDSVRLMGGRGFVGTCRADLHTVAFGGITRGQAKAIFTRMGLPWKAKAGQWA